MNTHVEYRRHLQQPHPDPSTAPRSEAIANHLALDQDPSQTATASPAVTSATGSTPDSRRIAWVRPSELASYASPLIGRGIDLHADLIRRARRAPVAARRTAHHTVDRAISSTHATHTAPDQEGIQL